MTTRKGMLAKPRAMKKMLRFKRRVEQGRYALQLLELNYDNRCNFTCEHCFSRFLDPGGDGLTLDEVANLADQAHEMGVWQWHLQGGEPLLWDDLPDVLEAIGTERFHVMVTTNGSLMTADKARLLADAGVDKIAVSIDSADAREHDAFRGFDGSWQRARKALFHARDAGMQVNINTVVTHQNVSEPGLMDIVRFAGENGFTVLFVVATPSGAWTGREDLLITEGDAAKLEAIRQEHPHVHRDLWPLFGVEWGCRTVNGLVYVTRTGDVLPCPFVHISLGNVGREPLRDILARGWRVKKFRDYSPVCLAGEDRDFIDRFMGKAEMGLGPVPFDAVFGEDDLYPEESLD